MAGPAVALADGPAAGRLARIERLLIDPPELTERQQAVRTVVLQVERANLTGQDGDVDTALRSARDALAAGHRHDDLALALAALHAACHELDEVDALLAAFPRAAGSVPGRTIRAGVLRQRGDVVGAARLYLDLAREEPSWTPIAGLAGLFEDLGDAATADALHRRAEDDIAATQLDSLAWVELQRARQRRRRGDLRRAELHLRRAEAADDGWPVREERARWCAAAGALERSVDIWTGIVEATERPDHEHALGDVLTRLERAQEALAHHAAACSAYERSAGLGRRRYVHHLAEFCLRVSCDLDAAERWARADRDARPNQHTGELLADVLAARGAWGERQALLAELAGARTAALTTLRHPDFAAP